MLIRLTLLLLVLSAATAHAQLGTLFIIEEGSQRIDLRSESLAPSTSIQQGNQIIPGLLLRQQIIGPLWIEAGVHIPYISADILSIVGDTSVGVIASNRLYLPLRAVGSYLFLDSTVEIWGAVGAGINIPMEERDVNSVAFWASATGSMQRMYVERNRPTEEFLMIDGMLGLDIWVTSGVALGIHYRYAYHADDVIDVVLRKDLHGTPVDRIAVRSNGSFESIAVRLLFRISNLWNDE